MPKNDEKCGFWSLFGHSRHSCTIGEGRSRAGRKGKTGNYWWLQLAFLFVLLLGGGFYAFFTMDDVAHELSGMENYRDEGEQSGVYGLVSLSKKNNDFSVFTEDFESKDDVKKESLSNSSEDFKKKELNAGFKRLMDKPDEDFTGNAGRYASAEKTSLNNDSLPVGLKRRFKSLKTPKKEKKLFRANNVKGKKLIFFSKERDKGLALINKRNKSSLKAGKMSAKSKMSALKGLRNSWKTNIYGARDASNDAARNWIAKTFDNTGDAEYSLEYDEKMKMHLDRLDPNSIPQYLRDQDVSVSSAKSLGIKDVNSPELEDDDSLYEAAQGMTRGLLNPMFSGMDFGGVEDNQEETIDDGETRGAPMADPNEDPNLDDSKSLDLMNFGCGEECGCSCDVPCSCLPPGFFDNAGDFPSSGHILQGG